MSNNPGLREKFNFRGSPSGTDDFYMLAVLKKEYISGNDGDSIKGNNGNNFRFLGDKADKYFFLCHNQYPDTTQSSPYPFYDRLYWSTDPDDFQYNDAQGYKNQGVARINAAYINGQLRLRYRSSFNGYATSKEDQTVYRNVGPDFNRLDINEKEGIVVSFNTKNDTTLQDYALKANSLFYSIPYSMENKSTLYSINAPNTFNSIGWTFRKYAESPALAGSSSGITVHTDGANNKDSAFNFVYLAGLTSETGASESNFNFGSTQYYVTSTTMGTSFYDSATSFSVADTDDLINENFFFGGRSLIKITSDTGTSSTVVNYNYHSKEGTSVRFHTSGMSSRGLVGSDYDIDINSGVSIYINQRNTDSCFAPLSNNSTFSEWFDIYLLPVEENMYLPGSHHTNDSTLFPDSCSLYRIGDFGENAITPTRGIQELYFFSPQTNEPFTLDQIRAATFLNDSNPNSYFVCQGDTQKGYNMHKATDYRKIYNLLFFFLIGSLNQLYWKVTNRPPPLTTTTSGYDTHPNIAVEPELDSTGKLDTDNKITFYGWDTHAESSAAYMFNYCRGSDVCGRCSGNNKDAENICFADKLTRPNAIKSNLPNRNAYPPLTGKERPTGTHSNPGNHLPTFVIVIIAVLVVALIVTIIAVAYVKRKKWRENSV